MTWQRTDHPWDHVGALLWLDGHLVDVARGWLRVTDPAWEARWAAFGDFDTALTGSWCAS